MKLLIIGYGAIGKRHAENALACVDQVAVVDNNTEVLSLARADSRLRVFSNLSVALAWQPDAVIIATPHDTHLPLAKMAITAGAHLLIEKPISHNVEGVVALLQMARSTQRKIYVVCNMRFHSAIAVLKENLTKIGKPWFARAHFGHYLPSMRPGRDYRALYAAHRYRGGGVIFDAIHEIDYLRWFFGEVIKVNAKMAKLSDLDIDVEDYACLLLHHQNGVQTEIHLDYLQACKRRGCEIVGEHGILIWHSEGKQPEICNVRFFERAAGVWKTLYQNHAEPVNKPYALLMQNWVNGLKNENQILATGEDGFANLQICLAAHAVSHREVNNEQPKIFS